MQPEFRPLQTFSRGCFARVLSIERVKKKVKKKVRCFFDCYNRDEIQNKYQQVSLKN